MNKKVYVVSLLNSAAENNRITCALNIFFFFGHLNIHPHHAAVQVSGVYNYTGFMEINVIATWKRWKVGLAQSILEWKML